MAPCRRRGDAAAGGTAVPAALAILAVRRDRRPAGGGMVQRDRRRPARLRDRAERGGLRQSRLSRRVCLDAAGAARRAEGRLSPVAASAGRRPARRLRAGYPVGARRRRRRGHRPLPARLGLGPSPDPPGRGFAGGRITPDRTAHPWQPLPRLDRQCGRGAGSPGRRGPAARHAGGGNAGPGGPVARRPGRTGREARHADPPGAAPDRAGSRRDGRPLARAGTAANGDRGPAEPRAGAARPRGDGAADPGPPGHRYRRRRYDRQRTGAPGRRPRSRAADPARQWRIRAVADRPRTGRAPSARCARVAARRHP